MLLRQLLCRTTRVRCAGLAVRLAGRESVGAHRVRLPGRNTKKPAPTSGAGFLRLWSRLGSNQRPSACEADALPLSHGTERGKTLTRGVAVDRIACSDSFMSHSTPVSSADLTPPDSVRPHLSHGSQPPETRILGLTTRFVSFTPVGLMFSPHHGDSNCPAVIASGVCGCGAVVAHHLAKVRVAGSNPVIRSRVSTHGGVAEW